MAKQTSLKLTDERQRKLDQASAIIATDEYDDPPMSVVLDAALDHLIASEKNIQKARDDDLDPQLVQRFNTPVIGLRYRTYVESRYRE